MALTRDFKETVATRVQNDRAFAQALLDEAITLFVNGEPESVKLILKIRRTSLAPTSLTTSSRSRTS